MIPIGDGAGPGIPLDILSHVHTAKISDFVYPAEILSNRVACLSRSILAPTNLQVDSYNETMLRKVDGAARVYLWADSLKEVDDMGLTDPDSILVSVAKHTPAGLLPHSLTVKVNGVFRLLRNFSVDRGLVKNVRVVVTHTGTRLITVRLFRGVAAPVNRIDDEDILIPRINFTATLPSGHTLSHRQFPVAPAYATTFNSCQGLTLNILGVISLDQSSHTVNFILRCPESVTDRMPKFVYAREKLQLQM